jgi:methionine synthase II (cobalamin-independent)
VGLSVAHRRLSARDHDEAAEALEAGQTVALGVVPSTDPEGRPTAGQVTEGVVAWLEMLGLDPERLGDRLVLSPSCGLAGAGPEWAGRALSVLRETAAHLSR